MAVSMSPAPAESTRDLIVVGCSAGGVDALPRLLHPLPHDLPASIVIVQHMGPSENPALVQILRRSSALPVDWAEQGARIERGRVYVAPPDTHVLFADSHLQLSRGPRENHSRPSIDKLFRSAAATHGGRVIGVLLTGMLDDGALGLRAIHEAGGLVIVQDPRDAAFPDLPRNALLAVDPDAVLPIVGIAPALVALTAQPAAASAAPPGLATEAEADRVGVVTPSTLHSLGPQTAISCPRCKGPTWLLGDEHGRRYRCYQGHVSTAHDLLLESGLEVETALWSAVRALTDRAMTLETLSADAEKLGRVQIAELYSERAREVRKQAELARQFLIDVVKPT
jgi:two-component system chemotaxis response regulator CheB